MMITPRAHPYPAPAVAAAVRRGLVTARDRPNPVADADRTPEKYARLAEDFRRSAWKHLDENDLPQASNKGWGLVAETVKSVCAQHGGFIHTHRSIQMVVRELARVAGNAGDTTTQEWINGYFIIARSLHSNYYEDEAEEDDVRGGLRQCEQLAERLVELFGVPSPDGDEDAAD